VQALTALKPAMLKHTVWCRGVIRMIKPLMFIGTGTPVGDPLEAAAIGYSFAAGKHQVNPVYVSSLKANFGHLEGAAGIAGLIKTVLVLERGIIPPLANFESVNADIDVDFLNIQVSPLT
jgi:acyl transferase domain-containing protein